MAGVIEPVRAEIDMMTTVESRDLGETVEILRFLSDRNRLRIIALLTRAEMCVCDLIEELQMAQPLMSYHLGKMRKAGLVQSRRDGQWVYYSLDPVAWERRLQPLAEILAPPHLPPDAAYGAGRHCAPAAEPSAALADPGRPMAAASAR